MAVTIASDLKVYESQVATARTETLQQNVEQFNAATNGAFIMRSSANKGNYEYESFFLTNGALIARQDITSTSALTPTKLTQDDNVKVKLHRRGATDIAYKGVKQAGFSMDEAMYAHGQQFAAEYMSDMVNTALLAARVAIANQATNLNDITGATTKTITHAALLNTLRKFGDRSDRLAAWVMHSTQFFDLGLASITDNVTNIADGIIRRVDVPGLGRPILVTDSDSLIATADTPDSYYVLGLAQGAIDLNENGGILTKVDDVTGLEQLVARVQQEYDYTLGVKGFKWDVANGAANPNAAAIGTATNWDKVATSYKDLAGVALKCQAA